MRGPSFRVCLRLASALSLVGSIANAEVFYSDLPDLLGPNQFEGLNDQAANYDFGLDFSAINDVYIQVEATVTPTEWDQCGTQFEPLPCEHVIIWNGFGSSLDIFEADRLILATLNGYGTEAQEVTARFRTRDDDNLDFMLDGAGQVRLLWNHTITDPDLWVINIVQPTAVITRAQLVVEAVPVPEPSARVSAWTALLVLLSLRRIRAYRILRCSQLGVVNMKCAMSISIAVLAFAISTSVTAAEISTSIENSVRRGEPVKALVVFETREIDFELMRRRVDVGADWTAADSIDYWKANYPAVRERALAGVAGLKPSQSFRVLPMAVVLIESQVALDHLMASPDVRSVSEDMEVVLTTAQSLPLIEQPAVVAAGIDGSALGLASDSTIARRGAFYITSILGL